MSNHYSYSIVYISMFSDAVDLVMFVWLFQLISFSNPAYNVSRLFLLVLRI